MEEGIPQKVSRTRGIPRKIAIVMTLTALFTVAEIVGSWLSGSLTLLAEAGHMITDVGALALALYGAHVAARREGSPQHFGNLRWEVMAAMVNGLMLFVIGAWITLEAIQRFAHPNPINATLFGVVAAIGLGVNLISLRVLHGDHQHSLNARGAYLHILGDVLGSIGAIVGAIVIHYTNWLRVDPIISVLVSVVILRSSWRLIKESGTILLDKVPPHLPSDTVEQKLMGVAGVVRIHDLHLWTVTSGLIAMSAHAVVPDLVAHPDVLHDLQHAMNDLGILHVTIQLETRDDCEGELCGDAEDPLVHRGHSHDHAHHGHSHAH